MLPVKSRPEADAPLAQKKVSEDDANAFAVELLMKKEWYEDFVKDRDPGIETIRQAAEYFGVSLSAAAIRYSQAGNFPVAVIMSRRKHGGQVSWSAVSESFPYQYIPKGYPVNGSSEASSFFKGDEIDTEPHEVFADSWFLDDRSFRKNHSLLEQCLPMPNYDSVLTVVWEQ
ncbi:MAG: ImmA/IrrE family metallo-endopeptidase [Candidatus Kryptoniota bacterium]